MFALSTQGFVLISLTIQILGQHYFVIFDVNNLKTERRRKQLMKHSDVDLIETIANCYQLEENLLRKYVEENEDTYVCDACFKSLKTIYNSQKQCKQLTDTLKKKFLITLRISPSS